MEENEILNRDIDYRYRLLSRLQQDCEYYLGWGQRDSKRLWAQNEKDQIEMMRLLYNSFTYEEQPQWIALSDIDEYEKRMNN